MQRKTSKKQRSRVHGKVKFLTEVAGLVGHSHVFCAPDVMLQFQGGWKAVALLKVTASLFPPFPCSSSWCREGVRDISGLKLNQGEKGRAAVGRGRMLLLGVTWVCSSWRSHCAGSSQ